MNRLMDRARISLGWWLDDVGYRLREVAVRVSGGRTHGPDPLTLSNVLEVADSAGIPAHELIAAMERRHDAAT